MTKFVATTLFDAPICTTAFMFVTKFVVTVYAVRSKALGGAPVAQPTMRVRNAKQQNGLITFQLWGALPQSANAKSLSL